MKDKLTAGLLAIFLWGLWFHKFYIGKPWEWVFYILFCWTFIPSIFALVEGIMYISCPSDKAFNEKYVPLKVRKEITERLQQEKEEESNIKNGTETNTKGGNLDDIKKLKELLDMGAITQEEFDLQKKKILV